MIAKPFLITADATAFNAAMQKARGQVMEFLSGDSVEWQRIQAEERRRRTKALMDANRGSGALRTPMGKIGRNEPCPCGSGKKFKHCHMR